MFFIPRVLRNISAVFLCSFSVFFIDVLELNFQISICRNLESTILVVTIVGSHNISKTRYQTT
jgi:hypothetical protein